MAGTKLGSRCRSSLPRPANQAEGLSLNHLQQDENNEIYKVNETGISVDIGEATLEGNTAMQYIKNSNENTSYWDYIVGDLKAEVELVLAT